MTPIVYRKAIRGESGNILGHVEVFENEEVADAIFRFSRKSKETLDLIGLKNYFFSEACRIPRVRCTRNYAFIFDEDIKDMDGTIIGRLNITEFDQPPDKIYQWCKEKSVAEHYIFNLISTICEVKGVFCERKVPLIFGPQKISDKDGRFVGNFEVKLNQEPVDALYQFFAKYRLFEKEWDMKAVLDQVCQFKELTEKCMRRKAVKYLTRNFTLGQKNFGPLVIWEDEEVIDKLYEIRIKYNLTLADQMAAFAEICHKDEIYCARTRAIIYKLDDINKSDFEHFGNETCLRYFAGW